MNTTDTHGDNHDDREPRIGDRGVSFLMQPCRADGSYFHGGNHYANADTLDAARDYAHRILTAPPGRGFCCVQNVASVSISGGTYEFTGGAWSPVYGKDTYRHHETITRADVPAHRVHVDCVPTTW